MEASYFNKVLPTIESLHVWIQKGYIYEAGIWIIVTMVIVIISDPHNNDDD